MKYPSLDVGYAFFSPELQYGIAVRLISTGSAPRISYAIGHNEVRATEILDWMITVTAQGKNCVSLDDVIAYLDDSVYRDSISKRHNEYAPFIEKARIYFDSIK